MSQPAPLTRTAVVALLTVALLAAVWVGLIVALSFIEAPLKFQAPGITTALGLGIGRLVFGAANIAGLVLFTLIAAAAAVAGRLRALPLSALVTQALLLIVLLLQVFVIRPPLNERSDRIIAGEDPGESSLHVLYIVAEVGLLVLLVTLIALVARRVLSGVPAAARG